LVSNHFAAGAIAISPEELLAWLWFRMDSQCRGSGSY